MSSAGFSALGAPPEAPSRWTKARDADWVALRPEDWCARRIRSSARQPLRHAFRFLRWRPDKAAEECGYDQLLPLHPFDLGEIVDLATSRSRLEPMCKGAQCPHARRVKRGPQHLQPTGSSAESVGQIGAAETSRHPCRD